MPLLAYFLSVGTALFGLLLFANHLLDPDGALTARSGDAQEQGASVPIITSASAAAAEQASSRSEAQRHLALGGPIPKVNLAPRPSGMELAAPSPPESAETERPAIAEPVERPAAKPAPVKRKVERRPVRRPETTVYRYHVERRYQGGPSQYDVFGPFAGRW